MKRNLSVEYRDQNDKLIDHSKISEHDIPKRGQVIQPFHTLNGAVRWYVTRVLIFVTDWKTIDHIEIMIDDLGFVLDYDFYDLEPAHYYG